MGLEYLKWSDRATPRHDVTLPFTRMLAGPMDYTPGGFRNVTAAEFAPRNRLPLVIGTRAHQLALYVVFDGPLQMLADSPAAYRGEPGLEFLKAVPASWDETKVLDGKIGEYAVIARRRGTEWFIGAITDAPRRVQVPLAFLGPGPFEATVYADVPESDDRHRRPRDECVPDRGSNPSRGSDPSSHRTGSSRSAAAGARAAGAFTSPASSCPRPFQRARSRLRTSVPPQRRAARVVVLLTCRGRSAG